MVATEFFFHTMGGREGLVDMVATEFFFHTMGGREGLVDTAVKTAETGYMQRRLMKAFEELHVHYDDSVRNASGALIQFTYGDDILDPAKMETQDQPANLPTIWGNIQHRYPCNNELPLSRTRISELLDEDMKKDSFMECAEKFRDNVREFVEGQFIHRLEKLEKMYHHTEPCACVSMTEFCPVHQLCRVTKSQLERFMAKCCEKYHRAKSEPGTAVGALCGQSIGEPGAQMTLKTFHFAGVASMNVTLGVPRIKEIINASKSISTPITTATLVDSTSTNSARVVKGRIERTVLGEIVSSMKEVYNPHSGCYISIILDEDTISKLQLGEVDVNTVKQSIIDARALKMKLKDKNILITGRKELRVTPIEQTKDKLAYSLLSLRKALPLVPVCGVPGVSRAVISKEKDQYMLQVEGANLRGVMNTPGVIGEKTTCNHVMEVEQILGVEAARNTIMNEISMVMKNHGMSIDTRHLTLLSDLMTCKGQVLGITRFGISKMAESVLMMASFERTTDFLFDAAVHSRVDHIVGVSECIIMGVPIPLGTGLFKVLLQHKDFNLKKRPTLF